MIKKRKFWLYVILEIVTLGIYGIFFWYKWTKDLNKICDGDDKDSANYILVMLLNVFSLGIYIWVWNYQMAERMFQIAPQYGVEIKHGGMFVLAFRFFIPVVGNFFKVSYLNKLAAAYNAQNASVEPAPASVEEAPAEAAPADAASAE